MSHGGEFTVSSQVSYSSEMGGQEQVQVGTRGNDIAVNRDMCLTSKGR